MAWKKAESGKRGPWEPTGRVRFKSVKVACRIFGGPESRLCVEIEEHKSEVKDDVVVKRWFRWRPAEGHDLRDFRGRSFELHRIL